MSRYEDSEGTADHPPAGGMRTAAAVPHRGTGGDGAFQDVSGRPRSDRARPVRANTGRRPGSAGHAVRGPARPRRETPRTHRVLGRHPVLSVLAILATVMVTFISLSAYAAFRNVYDSIHHVTVTSGMLGHRPPKLNGSENILIIGSDSRAGSHGRYGHDIPGARSDTSMLLHIPPTHTGAIVLSFPRDTMVPIYQCEADGNGHPGQQAGPGSVEQLNWTFSNGGAACLWKTLEQVTHIRIDHFVEVNFGGFRSIVNDVGGVPVCLPYAIHDPASHLNLSAGKHTVDGAQALAFVRERHIGLGSDLQRINRQQLFLASLAQKVKQSSSLTNPARLYQLVHDIASSLTTDSGLTFTGMYAIANSLKGLSTSSLQFIMAPVAAYPPNPGSQVQFNQPAADQLFSAVARDNHILKTARRAEREKPAPVPTVVPGKVHVQVLNGTTITGLAAATAGQLSARGFTVAGVGDAPSAASATVIQYGNASLRPEVNTLAQEVRGAQVRKEPSLAGSVIDLVLGPGFKGIGRHRAHAKAPSTSAAALSRSYGGVNGSANICKDTAAFTGPDNPTMFGN